MIRFSFITARAASLLLGVIALGLPTIHAVDPRPLTLDELFKFQRVSDPQVSPDGRHVVYVVTEVLKEENRTQSDLWLAPTIGEAAPRRLTFGPTHDRHPRWSPDGRWIAFESNREGDYQIYLLPVADQGGEARRLTTLATGATGAVWAPAGDQLAFVSEVFPEFSHEAFAEAEAHARARIAAEAKAPVKARVATQLLYRHWDAWVGGRRQHLFVIPVRDGAATGEPRNVTPGDNDAVPTSSTFSAGDDHAFSPDGASLAFTAPPLPVREQAWSTNHDLWLVNLATLERRHLTTNPAADGYPRFSPDGRTLAYRAQARAGFEADRWQLRQLDLATGASRSLTAAWDRSVEAFVWAPDGSKLYCTAQDAGAEPVWAVPATDGAGAPVRLTAGGVSGDLSRNDAVETRFLR